MSVQFQPSDPEEPHEGGGAGDAAECFSAERDETAGEPPTREPHWAELSALVSRAEANRADMCRLQAERAEICAAAIDVIAHRASQRQAGRITPMRGEIGDEIPLREALAELGAALRVTERTLQSWFGAGDALVRTLPATLEALRTARIDERHASAIIDGAVGLAEEHRSAYQEQALAAADEQTGAGLRETARVIAARLQPELVEQDAQNVYDERDVRAYRLGNGGARLQADGPAAIVFAMFDRLTQMATQLQESARAESGADAASVDGSGTDGSGADDSRSRDEIRFDILTDLLLTGAPAAHGDPDVLGAIRGEVQVTIPVLTLAGLDDEPALLAGHGPIDAATARRLAGTADVWERVLIHPSTGLPLAVDRYRPSAAQKRLLKARDRHCRWPGCRRPVKKCDDEHNIPYSEGGQTCVCNMSEFCRRHHVLKHASFWQVINHGGGVIEFISPTGRRYRNHAPPVLEYVRPTWMGPEPSRP